MRISGRIWPAALAAAAVLAAAALPLSAQFRPAEIAQRESWEEFMRTADILKSEPEDEGVTHPWKLTLRRGDVEHKAVWKNIDIVDGEIPDRWRYEIAAYRLDKLLGLNMVPPVVEREFQGKAGDLSLWAENKYSLLKIMEENIPIPESARGRVDDMKYVTRAWDSLLANDDRTQQNILYTEDWRTILIDHTRAFRSDKAHRERLIYGSKGIKTMDDGRGGRRAVLFRRLPRAFVEKIRSLEKAAVQAAVGPYLTEAEINALMARKPILLAEIDEMIKRDGEKAVLYEP
jgi:hypothetical protein